MSNIYALEPHTNGKVILHTTAGDVEIELWGKETPRAARNFIQLCMEGYYDNTIFHRIVPHFIIQGGDPSGTGQGGESIYEDEAFPPEYHSRLRFNRRGLVGMANMGDSEQASQFFITLDTAEELTKTHTLFGRVAGDTIYNVLKMGEMQTDANERPLYPPRVKTTEVVLNPFDDIVPRISERERKHARALEKQKALAEQDAKKKKKKEKKQLNLLSFGEEAEEMEVESNKGMKSSHDFLPEDKQVPPVELPPPKTVEKKRKEPSPPPKEEKSVKHDEPSKKKERQRAER
ncbi:cyclophilin-like domain-containing protein [Fennellomyces sp. T-0311]|nr:cyclophilin-like domain-containing protein [Fennellomyces sp. T-0311]